MARQTITSGGTGGFCGWFDDEAAIKFEESTWFDGSNHVSNPTGSQWRHEALYRTSKGNWILNRWSQMQQERETYELIDGDEAVAWLIAEGHACDDEQLQRLPAGVADWIRDESAKMEI